MKSSLSTDQHLSAMTYPHHLSSYMGENHPLTYLSGRGNPKVNLAVLRQQNKIEQAQHDNIQPVGSHVMFITPPEKRWHPAIIQEYLGHWSYKV